MLDMLMTADAARKHDLDSTSSSPHATPARNGNGIGISNVSFLPQMSLSLVGSFLRRQSPSPAPSASPSPPTKHDSAISDALSTPRKAAMPTFGDTPLASPTHSRPATSDSSATAEDRPKKRASRPKTSYICARPPRPVDPRSKLHLRPKVLLQLHQVISSQRPKPAYEVVPFSLLPARSTRLLARTFNTRDKLNPHDLLIVKAEEYGSKDEEAKSDDDRWGHRDVIGVICLAKSDKDATEICMDDGKSRWEVTNMPNGGFEFNTTDDHGLTLKARWVPKPAHGRRVSSMSASSQPTLTQQATQDDKKYTFSTISSSSRRHPIIATMTRTRIDVMDSYSMPSSTSPSTPGAQSRSHSPAVTPASIDMDAFMDKRPDQSPIRTDDALRRFIVASGIWVLSDSFCTSNNSSQSSTPSLDITTPFRSLSHRTSSLSVLDTPRSTSPVSISDENRRSFPRMIKTGLERLPRSTSFTEASSPLSAKATPNASPTQKTRSRRANSTGNTNLHSMSGSMRKRYHLAFEGQTVPESEEERQTKRSVELMRIKELASPSPASLSSDEKAQIQPLTASVTPSPISTPAGSGAPTPVLPPPAMSPALPDPERKRKTQSAYDPVDTAGMWDSGVTERPGLKARPTSMFVMNERKRKQDKKRGRSKSKEGKVLDNDKGSSAKKPAGWHKMKISLKSLFRREKA